VTAEASTIENEQVLAGVKGGRGALFYGKERVKQTATNAAGKGGERELGAGKGGLS